MGAKLLWFVYINMRRFFFFFFRLSEFVFILDEHPWHGIDVFVRLPKCRFNSAIILLPKKLIYFILVYLEISQVSFFLMCRGLLENVRL